MEQLYGTEVSPETDERTLEAYDHAVNNLTMVPTSRAPCLRTEQAVNAA